MMRRVLVVGLCTLLSALAAQAQPWFTEVSTNAGITHLFTRPTNGLSGGSAGEYYNMTGGAVAEDFNGDGWIDLYVLQCSTNANLLYINQGDGSFSNEAAAWGADISSQAIGATAADYDNDGDIDIAFSRMLDMPVVLSNNAAASFSQMVITNYLTEDRDFVRFTSPSWGDFNHDARLDLAIGQWFGLRQSLFMYINETNQFTEVEWWDGLFNSYVFSTLFADFDSDGWPELGLVSDFTNSQLFANTTTGFLNRVTATAGVGTEQNGMGNAVGDIDNDGDLDWFVTSIVDPLPLLPTPGKWGTTGNRLYRNDGPFVFSDQTSSAGVRDGNWGWGAAMGDLDNDGWLDIYHVNGWAESFTTNYAIKFNDRPALFFRNRGDGTFTNIAAEAGVADTGQGRGVILFDYDNDGDLDIYIANNQVLTMVGTNAVRTPGPPRLYRNDATNGHHWMKATLNGTPPLHRNGIGSRVYLTTRGKTQMRELNASSGYLAHGPNRIAHFGLGTNDHVDEVRGEWLTGDATVRYDVPANQAISLGSPQAFVSTNYFYGAGTVSVSATNVSPLGTPRHWVVRGVTNSDPLNVTLNMAGTHELFLHVYDASGTNLVWTEIRRVRVETAELKLISGIGPEWSIQWAARSGYVYQVQSAVNATGEWNSITSPQTNAVNDIISGTVTTPAPQTFFRLLENPAR